MSFLRTLETARRSRFAVPVALLLGLAVLLTNELGNRRALAVIESREALLDARVEVSLLLREVIAAESGQRGYLLTGRPEYKEPYIRAAATVDAQLAKIARMYARWPDREADVKKLEELVSVSVVDPLMLENGWEFKVGDGATGDHLFSSKALWEIYLRADPHYSGRVTVPVLWDRKTGTIVNNESSEIIRMFNSAFDHLTGSTQDFYPENLAPGIDEINALVYDTVNNGVYKAGFATTQEAYKQNVVKLFGTLDALEERLGKGRYLLGDRVTEADWRLFTTLVRFDPVYVGHFKCNIRRIEDYRNLPFYLRDLYQTPGVRETVNLRHIKQHYYRSHKTINPTGIVPVGPVLDLDSPHGRDKLTAAT